VSFSGFTDEVKQWVREHNKNYGEEQPIILIGLIKDRLKHFCGTTLANNIHLFTKVERPGKVSSNVDVTHLGSIPDPVKSLAMFSTPSLDDKPKSSKPPPKKKRRVK